MENNHIEIYKNALDDKICDTIVEIYENNKKYHITGATMRGIMLDLKKSQEMDLLDARKDNPYVESILLPSIKLAVRECLYKYTTKYQLTGSSYNPKDFTKKEWVDKVYEELAVWPAVVPIKKYNKGDGYFHWHKDMGGDMLTFSRQLVIQFYLNDVEEGGETGFYYQDIEYKPEKGTVLIFPAGFTHKHRGKMPISGDKYIMNLWLLHKIPPIKDIIFHLDDKNKEGW